MEISALTKKNFSRLIPPTPGIWAAASYFSNYLLGDVMTELG